MKNSIFKTIFTSLLIICISCGNDDNGGGVLNNDTYLTAKVDGVDYAINEIVAAAAQKDDGDGHYIINMSNKPHPDTEFGFLLRFPKSEGTFETRGDVNALGFIKMSKDGSISAWGASELYDESSGKITITKISAKSIEGTFSFRGESNDGSTIKVTVGKFKAIK